MLEYLKATSPGAELPVSEEIGAWDLEALIEFMMLIEEDSRQRELDGFDEARHGLRRALLEIGLALSSRVTASAYQGVLKINYLHKTSWYMERYATERDQVWATIQSEEQKWGMEALWMSAVRRECVDDVDYEAEYCEAEPNEVRPFRLVTDAGIRLYEQFHRREISIGPFMSAYRRIVPDSALADWQRSGAPVQGNESSLTGF